MLEKVLPKEAKRSLALLGESGVLKDAYLAGGTALALQLGHRMSVDFDFFSRKEFEERSFVEQITALSVGFKPEKIDWRTVRGYVGKTKFSLFFYDYPLLAKPKDYLNISIADIKDIAPMKLLAISDRGLKRDFIDLYFIAVVDKILTLEEIFRLYDLKFKKLQQNKSHILKSLSYFEMTDQPMPKMLRGIDWREVKKYFEKEAKALAKKFFGI